MKTVRQVLANSSSTTTRSTPPPLAPRLEQLLMALWKRMAQLYGHKWKSQHPLYDRPEHEAAGRYSEDFMLWARKTQHLSDAHWKRGMDAVEYRNREAARQGETDTWPPNYAEFVGMCEPAPGSRMYRRFEPLKLPDKGAQERARKAGAQELEKMKNLFSDQGE